MDSSSNNSVLIMYVLLHYLLFHYCSVLNSKYISLLEDIEEFHVLDDMWYFEISNTENRGR